MAKIIERFTAGSRMVMGLANQHAVSMQHEQVFDLRKMHIDR